jgi:uncharacterized protein YeaO (DUF488 family)
LSVKTKCIFEPIEATDGRRILITRYYPRGVKKEHFDEWVYTLSPSAKLLFSYKHSEKSWKEFREAFIQEIRQNDTSMEAILALNDASKGEDITLLCYEKSGTPCHRHLVRDIVAAPFLLSIGLEAKHADDHEGSEIPGHVSNEKAEVVSVLS